MGELRQRILEAIAETWTSRHLNPSVYSDSFPGDTPDSHDFEKMADAVLAVLAQRGERTVAGEGLTKEEIGLIVDSVDDWAKRFDRGGGGRLSRLCGSIRSKFGYPVP